MTPEEIADNAVSTLLNAEIVTLGATTLRRRVAEAVRKDRIAVEADLVERIAAFVEGYASTENNIIAADIRKEFGRG